MAERVKMPRGDRAKQFAPFDALKGLQDTLRIKEYEHDRVARGEMSEDAIKDISLVLADLEKGDCVEIEFFRDGHMIKLCGVSWVDVSYSKIHVGAFEIDFDEIHAIKKTSRED